MGTKEPLFVPVTRVRAGLTGEAIRQLLARRALAAGVARISPHDLRRSYAGDLLDAGADLPALADVLERPDAGLTVGASAFEQHLAQLCLADLTEANLVAAVAAFAEDGHAPASVRRALSTWRWRLDTGSRTAPRPRPS